MAEKNTSITATTVYSDSIKAIRADVERLFRHGMIRMPARVPSSLVSVLKKRADRDFALREVKDGIAVALNDYCLVGSWTEGVDENGAYIQFYLEPEKVKDEA